MNSKSIFVSKTFWANIVAVAGTLLAGYGFDISTETQAEIVAGMMAVLNIGLRLMTSRPVHLK